MEEKKDMVHVKLSTSDNVIVLEADRFYDENGFVYLMSGDDIQGMFDASIVQAIVKF